MDRIDSNGDYEPGNCRWASRKLQNRNRRSNKLSVEKVAAIFAMRPAGLTWKQIAGVFEVSKTLIGHILKGKTWSNLT